MLLKGISQGCRSRHTVRRDKNGRYPSGIARFLRLPFLLLALSCSQGASADELSLNDIAQLSRGGAAELALSLLAQGQGSLLQQEGELNEWMRWERLRVRILEQQQDWAVLSDRLAAHPEGLPEAFIHWAMLRRAIALVKLGEYSSSRALLRELIWHSTSPPGASQLMEYRHWLIQGYLREGRTEDALAAMTRYRQDYGDGDEQAQLLRARVLLASERAAEAHHFLAGLAQSNEARLLRQLAALRSGEPTEAVLSELSKLSPAGEGERLLRDGIQVEAAKRAEQTGRLAQALQDYLSHPAPLLAGEGLFAWNADELWRYWLEYGTALGNSEQLLIGDDEAWLKAAAATTPRYPVRKRALLAVVALRGGARASREEAHRQLALLLLEGERAPAVRLLQQLYLHAPAHLDDASLPEPVAFVLVDEAIRSGDLQMASRLMRLLAEPPEGTARFAWQLRRAKVFILAAQFEAVSLLFDEILPTAARLGSTERDQLVQLLFDLQNVGQHALAYELFEALYQQISVHEFRRELLFWMAESRAALDDDVHAARLYLQSATLGDVHSMDPWAQTARYQAANSLAKAGLLRDAAFIYQQLLRVTESQERRAVLLRELEELRMRQAAAAH